MRVLRPVVLAALGLFGSMAEAGSASSASMATPGVLVVGNDRGGFVVERAQEIRDLNARGVRVEIRGRACMSSCTMYLGAHDLCVDPETVFVFHGPSRYGRALEPHVFEHFSQLMARHYNAPLAEWWLREGRGIGWDDLRRIKGANIIALGYPSS